MSGFYSKNVQELGSQVPDFLHVCNISAFQAEHFRLQSCYGHLFENIKLNKEKKYEKVCFQTLEY